MTIQEVEKYRLPVRILHWIHTCAFIILFLTGLVFFIPVLGLLAGNAWTHLIHRIAAVIFILGPVLYLTINPAAAARGLKKAFTWGAADLGWLKAAPRYYFLGDEKAMPPQDFMNSGQKLWWLTTVVSGFVFAISGLIMWFGKTTVPFAVLGRIVFIHDIAFIVTGAMFFLHIYLGAFHPLMKEAWKAMTGGKISVRYAKMHHGKWYEEIARAREEKTR
jgi:formate dehydrogenase subunit gamma